MKKITLCFIIVLLVLITGCSSALSKNAGTYQLDYYKFVGDSENEKNTENKWELVLKSDGTGESFRNGTSYVVEWSMNNDEINIIEQYGIAIDYKGTIKNNILSIYNGDKNNSLTVEYVFKKK